MYVNQGGTFEGVKTPQDVVTVLLEKIRDKMVQNPHDEFR